MTCHARVQGGDGRPAPGSKRPREANLADDLGIGRNSQREAVRALSLIRILDVRQGDGTYATSLQPEILNGNDGVHRRCPPGRRRAPTVRGAPGTRIGRRRAGGTPVANDLEFHRLIAVGSGNPVLCSLIDGLSGRTQRGRVWRGLTQEDTVTQTIREHRAIATAIRDRQPAIARPWTTAHIAGVETWLRHSLADPDSPGLWRLARRPLVRPRT